MYEQWRTEDRSLDPLHYVYKLHVIRVISFEHIISHQMLAESLCSILLLEESSPRQVFTEFILARKAALQEIFHPCQHGEIFYFLLPFSGIIRAHVGLWSLCHLEIIRCSDCIIACVHRCVVCVYMYAMWKLLYSLYFGINDY